MSTTVKDWVERVVVTFLMAAVGAFVLPVTDLYNMAAWKSVVLAAAVAGVNAVFRLITASVGPQGTTSVVEELEPKAA